MGEFLMPSLGADMEYGTIVEWRVSPGDSVHRGDIVAVVDTEKSTIEVEVFEDGVVEELLVLPGVEVPVGTALARLVPVGAAPSPIGKVKEDGSPRMRRPPRQARQVADRTLATVGPPSPRTETGRGDAPVVRAAPRARRQAQLTGVDLSKVKGTGPGGAVLTVDLSQPLRRAPTASPSVAPPGAPQVPSDGPKNRIAAMRHAIGLLMGRSKREIPHYYLATTVDMSKSLGWLAEANQDRGVETRLLPAALLLKASALAARHHPEMNGFWSDHREESRHVHLGVAVSLRSGGLVAPAIHDADQLSLTSSWHP